MECLTFPSIDTLEQFHRTGVKVLQHEAESIKLLARSIGSDFSQAVKLLAATQGRVIVTGMGKSGHISRKIAATLASTGQPAHFVHPAEASHGDLGMLAHGDTLLILSNSGETPELADIMIYAKRYGIPMIGIAGKANSELINRSDVGIVLPAISEAGLTGMVPTTSTIMMLALGDALVISLMEHRGFTQDLFRTFHPGGKLGARLTRVADLMHTGNTIPLVPQETPMPTALLEMTQKGFGVAGITSPVGKLVGIITDGDLRRHMDGLLQKTACNVMTPSPIVITETALAEEALAIMYEKKVTCLLVVENSNTTNVVGILHVHDCLRAGIA